MATIELGGKVTNEKGTALQGLTVQLYTASAWEAGGSVTATDTTDSDGLWNFDAAAEGSWIVAVNNSDSTKKLLFDGRNEVQFQNVDIRSALQVNTIQEATSSSGVTILGASGAAGVLYIKGDAGEDNGDEWKINVADGGTMTIGNDASGSFVTHLTLTPNSTVASSSVTFPGILDVNGSIDFDGTAVDVDASGTVAVDAAGAVTITSTSTSANGIYLRANGGTSETVKIHADQGTSVTEGAASVSLVSDAGGVELRSTANLANAINITNEGGTSGTITIFNDSGTAVTDGAASIQLLSDDGGVGIKSGLNNAAAIRLSTTAGGITLNPVTFVTVGGNATNAGEIRLLEDSDDGCLYVALKAPNVTGSYTITLPTAVAGGNCYVLKSNTSGVTSWAVGALNSLVEDTSPQVGGTAGLDLTDQLLVGNGGTTGIAISANGEVTMAAQPAFLAHVACTIDNVTGDGTDYTVAFDVEDFDQNGDFNLSNETFTAPVTGRYRLTANVSMTGITSSHTSARIQIIQSGGGNAGYSWNPYATYSASLAAGSVSITTLVDMDASDTATVLLDVSGGAQVVDIIGSSNHHNFFAGELVV